MNGSDDRVDTLLKDIHALDAGLHEIMQSIRKTVRDTTPAATEKVMYGGILFADGPFSYDMTFCGVFAYRQHVSLEFGNGSELHDTHGVLEGSGKFRRHIKLRTTAEIAGKHVRDYLRQALEKVRANHGGNPQ